MYSGLENASLLNAVLWLHSKWMATNLEQKVRKSFSVFKGGFSVFNVSVITSSLLPSEILKYV